MTIRISIVVPVHGRAHLTARCLDMVLGELPADAELVVVDDASPDATPELLKGYGSSIRSLRLEENGGYARACNAGAELARGELLIFLNNDVEPIAGWLRELETYAEVHPEAAAVGAKLLYPNGTVQHGGVVFGQDGYPHHLYAGFSADHPAVNRSRPLQAVTGACMLVRRSDFEAADGFDTGFLNSLEDVDLCLRLGKGGGEVHYCHQAVLVHLESASRGRSDRFERSLALYRERWREQVRRDDLEVYLADGLLAVEYHDAYPARFSIEPKLAVVDCSREEGIERLLEGYALQNSALLQEVLRLSAAIPAADEIVRKTVSSTEMSLDREAFLSRARELEEEIRQLQSEAMGGTGVEASTRLGYAHLVEQVQEAVNEHLPCDARVLVVSRGDRELLRFDGRQGMHFPQDETGRYAGHHPVDSEEAIAELEVLRRGGAEFLVFPPTASWWLKHYRSLAGHLAKYRIVCSDRCEIFDLRHPVAPAEKQLGSSRG